MKFKALLVIAIAMILISCEGMNKPDKMNYPESRKSDASYIRFGDTIPEPYDWLEDDRSEETEKWVTVQNKFTEDYLTKIPFRDDFKNRLTELNNYPKYGAPSKLGDKYLFSKNDGLQNQSVYYIQDDLESEPRVFFDPNKLSVDGTVSAGIVGVSQDDKYLAINIAKSGSDWQEFQVMDVESGEFLQDKVEWVKFSGASFYKDGFFYSRYDKPKEGSEYSGKNEFHKLYYHKLGTDQSEDKLVLYYPKEPQRNIYASVTDDEKYLVINVSAGTGGNMVIVKDMEENPVVDDIFNAVTVIDNFDYESSLIGNISNKIMMVTNMDAPMFKLVQIEMNGNEFTFSDVIAEKESLLRSVSKSAGKLFANYLEDVTTKIYQYAYDGTMEKEIELPGIGSAGGFGGKDDATELFYTFTSFNFPSTIFRYDVASGESSIFRESELQFNPEDYEVKQFFYASKDGTKIPMFIVHKKGVELNGNNPTLLYGYGGFNISLPPSFSATRITLLEQGGVYAQANLRGGGEYGEKWHKAGTKMQKQNVFDDFIAAGEWLIKEQYTSSEKLAIEGRSNGGLLVGACMTQRPDLFDVAFPGVGVLDMLKFHKFTIGWAWMDDYGNPEEGEMYKYLKGFSPLHNLKDGTEYPATMVTTADHDDRVVPAHSFKFAARLQEAHSGSDPVLIRIETKAGHGAGKSLTKQIEERADMYAFMFSNMGITPTFK